ncbi:MAG TPA: 4Fe-4S binding protein [Armatimonadota bacterium]|nr:4Fe-4S binding protein [Armatimonadota bacterium]
MFCGYCQDACPVEAIILRPIYEISEYTRDAEIYTKDMLLMPYPNPQTEDLGNTNA